jgi:hypothetical protein
VLKQIGSAFNLSKLKSAQVTALTVTAHTVAIVINSNPILVMD